MRKMKKLVVVATVTVMIMSSLTVYAAPTESETENNIVEEVEGEAIASYALGELPITIGNETDIKQQIPQELTEFPQTMSEGDGVFKAGTELDIESAEIMIPAVTRQVIAGRVQDYLTQTGDLKVLPLSINPGVYLQAQLSQPANPSLDYDLYILDAEGNILTGCEYITKINGLEGTLQESTGYITQGTGAADYYLAVLSSNGGSINENFTLEYSVSNAYDQLEPSENVAASLPFTYGINGALISAANLSSPVDNDWYVVTVPGSRIYDELILNISTPSTNTSKFEVYRNTLLMGIV